MFFDSETFTSNGDMCREAINVYGTLTYSSEYTIASGISGSYASSTLGRSLIYVRRSQQLELRSMTYSANWKFETEYNTAYLRPQLLYVD